MKMLTHFWLEIFFKYFCNIINKCFNYIKNYKNTKMYMYLFVIVNLYNIMNILMKKKKLFIIFY